MHCFQTTLFSNKSKSDVGSYFSSSTGDLAFRSNHRRLTRTRKLRHLTDEDILVSSPRSSCASTHPLPLPEFGGLIRQDRKASSAPNQDLVSVPLPPPQKRGEDRDKHKNLGFGSRIGCQDVRKTNREPNGGKNNRRPNIQIYAPPVTMFPSPQRNTGDIVTSPSMFHQPLQTWSAPDNSPLHSPRISFHQSVTSPNTPQSPLHSRLSVDSNNARRETNNAQSNVHPLPLPPGAASTSQPASPHPATAKPENVHKRQWQKGKLIGRGTFGSVYVASNRETGALCAMKEVELLPDDPQSTECIRQLQQEIKVLSQLQHPNIVRYYGSEIVGDRFFIYLEYVHPGSINKYIHDHCGLITESIVRNFTRHILSGLAYLHSTKTIHRDIKGPNLLVDAYGVVKLADFGMAKHLNGQTGNLSLKGSPYWLAPELLQSVVQQDASPDLALAVDIWSLGCTIIEMLNGKPPWGDLEWAAAMFRVLKESPPIPETLSPEGKDFLRCCFRRNPAERPSASMLLEHSFVKNSHKVDISCCTQSINRMNLTDKRPRPGYKLDLLPVLVTEAQITKRKLPNPSSFMHDSFSPVRISNDLVGKLPI